MNEFMCLPLQKTQISPLQFSNCIIISFENFYRIYFETFNIFQLVSANLDGQVEICHFLINKGFIFNNCIHSISIRDLHVKSLSLMIYELRLKNLKLKKYMGIKKFSDRRIRLKMLLQTVILNLLVCIIWMSMNVQTKLQKFLILVTQYKRVHVFAFTKDSDKPTHDLRLYHYKFWEFLRIRFWNLKYLIAWVSQFWWPSENLPFLVGKRI